VHTHGRALADAKEETYLGVTLERVDRGVVDDAGAPGHDRDEVLGEVEEGVARESALSMMDLGSWERGC
jgi:hypothetical protein